METVNKYLKAYHTTIDMLTDRGYHSSTGENLEFLRRTPDEFSIMFKENKMDMTGIVDRKQRPVYVRIITEELSKKSFQEIKLLFDPIMDEMGISTKDRSKREEYLNILLGPSAPHIIVLYNGTIENGKLQVPRIKSSLKGVEFFEVQRMIFNITQMNYCGTSDQPLLLQSKFTLLIGDEHKAEANEIKKKYGENNMMQIRLDDPINQYYEGEVGQIYRIEKPGISIKYRIVVEGSIRPTKKK